MQLLAGWVLQFRPAEVACCIGGPEDRLQDEVGSSERRGGGASADGFLREFLETYVLASIIVQRSLIKTRAVAVSNAIILMRIDAARFLFFFF